MGQIPHVAHSMLQPGVNIGRHGVMEPPAMLGDVQGEGHLHTLLLLDHEQPQGDLLQGRAPAGATSLDLYYPLVILQNKQCLKQQDFKKIK